MQNATLQKPIDALTPDQALRAMIASHVAAVNTAASALPEIEAASQAVARALTAGASLYYAAAGSSGLMALADGSELPGTFGVAQSQIKICMAGGVPIDGAMPGNTEDDTGQAERDAAPMSPGDVAIVVSASGTTPFALAFAEHARAKGNTVIAIANVANSKLLQIADIAIALPTAPEVLAGSTRLGAGTVQKVALNMISTQAGVLMGHVHDGLMVNLHPDNIKLRQRAADIVTRIAQVPDAAAKSALTTSSYDTKLAVLIARGQDPASARTMLTQTGGKLRDCLKQLESKT